MTPERWQTIKELFHSALEREPASRASFLEEACGGDEPLRHEVESLIAAHEQPAGIIDESIFGLAADLLAVEQPVVVKGHRIGPYKIIHQIGRGGMGEVYLAQDSRLGRRIAIKLLPTRFTSDTDRVRRFRREARAASALNHPNILTIHEIDELDGIHFIATEFVEGHTLRALIQSSAIKPGMILDVAVQVASALAAAHQAGIVHRDIKPENVMLRHDGYVKVLDFGLAKLAERQVTKDDSGASFISMTTSPGIVLGTLSYMSPEQARGLPVDARTDIFSLGVMLYEMITGTVPFAAPTTGDALVALLEREPPPLAERAPDAPAEFQRILSKALAKEREDRYQTANEMLAELKALKQELELSVKLRRPGSSRSKGASKDASKSAARTATRDRQRPARRAVSERGKITSRKRGRAATIATLLIIVIIVVGLIFLWVEFFSEAGG